jgi:hypothetical protein
MQHEEPQPMAPKPSTKAAETKLEMRIAFREAQAALLEIEERTERWERSGATLAKLDELLAEPLARIELVRRSAANILARHRWQPHTASAGAIGASRPLNGGRRRGSIPSPRRRRRTTRKVSA